AITANPDRRPLGQRELFGLFEPFVELTNGPADIGVHRARHFQTLVLTEGGLPIADPDGFTSLRFHKHVSRFYRATIRPAASPFCPRRTSAAAVKQVGDPITERGGYQNGCHRLATHDAAQGFLRATAFIVKTTAEIRSSRTGCLRRVLHRGGRTFTHRRRQLPQG